MNSHLVKTKSLFRQELIKRIDLGNLLLLNDFRDDDVFSIKKREFLDWDDYNKELLKQSFSPSLTVYLKGYIKSDSGFLYLSGNPEHDSISNFKERITRKVDFLKRLNNKVGLLNSKSEETGNWSTKEKLDRTKVFIVHGHDNALKNEVARFIEKLGVEPIILHEKASSGKTIIEKIEEYSNVGFGIVLYTPCDIGGSKDQNGNFKNRARQNVVFEHGYLIGKIGRGNVCAIVKGEVEIPNDMSGVVYIPYHDNWKWTIVQEMKNSSYRLNLDSVFS